VPHRSLDPAPRRYSADVSLIRRSARGPAAAPLRNSPDEIEEWLLDGAMREHDMLALFEQLAWRLAAASLPVDRLSLHIGTLHPQIIGFAWNWSRDDGLCDEIKVGEGALESDAYRLSPLARCIEHGERFRADPRDAALQARFPFLAELAGNGFTEYAALPLGGDGYHNVMTVATKAPGGVTEADLQTLMGLRKLFALHVQRHIALRIAGNVLGTYLGTAAGARVLDGSIRRGSGEAISAVIMVSDLRGFTDLSGRLAGPDMIALLNAYFERMAGAVLAEDGEVLKFIGDGLLGVFPFAAFGEPAAAASAALAAARKALAAVEALNAAPGPLDSIAGWRPLRAGIALHAGEVFFGNIGAAERLDFTVIGRAVNEASRVEGLCKPLGRPLLMTGAVASLLGDEAEPLGAHHVQGVAEPLAVFAPREVPVLRHSTV
jgi:adenylate cyclase